MRELVIGGIPVPIRSSEKLTQSYNDINASTVVRMSNGTAKKQTAWAGKIETVITGEGIMPVGLQMLDISVAHTIKCIQHRVVTSASNVIDVPASRRSDYGVEGRAVVGSRLVSTPVTMSGDEATLTAVTDAEAYHAVYWPELTCFIDPIEEDGTVRGNRSNWTIRAEEV